MITPHLVMDVEGKKKIDGKFDMLSEIVAGRENICIKVRVLRMWKVPTFMNPSETNTLELVLVDEKVGNLCWVVFVFSYIFLL